MSFGFVKGHGTHNDFVVLPDLDGSLHGALDPSLVVALCDRRGGLGADGVLRVLASDDGAPWFMDYRNADGSVSEMCGNGVRVFARYLEAAGLVDPSKPLDVDTRAGVKRVTFCDDGEISVDMGAPVVRNRTAVSSGGRSYEGRVVDTGNPHAVVVVDDLGDVGNLSVSPLYDLGDFPNGVNVEFVERRSDHELAMRVYERGVGETASCGTGAVAAAAAIAALPGGGGQAVYTVNVSGGVLTVTFDEGGAAQLKGPAVLVAEGTWTG
jgi:diaminopimelate epimerase